MLREDAGFRVGGFDATEVGGISDGRCQGPRDRPGPGLEPGRSIRPPPSPDPPSIKLPDPPGPIAPPDPPIKPPGPIAPANDIAFSSDRDGNDEIYVMNADGSGQARLTDNSAVDISPTWSPDGAQNAFTTD